MCITRFLFNSPGFNFIIHEHVFDFNYNNCSWQTFVSYGTLEAKGENGMNLFEKIYGKRKNTRRGMIYYDFTVGFSSFIFAMMLVHAFQGGGLPTLLLAVLIVAAIAGIFRVINARFL